MEDPCYQPPGCGDMWKFSDYVYMSAQGITEDSLTGEAVPLNPTYETVKGSVVPAGYKDIQKGFQMGEYVGYFHLPCEPKIKVDQIQDVTDNYDILGVEWWKDKGLFVLRLSK